jgi:hypothetical protein
MVAFDDIAFIKGFVTIGRMINIFERVIQRQTHR